MAIIRSGTGADVCLSLDPTFNAVPGSFRTAEYGGNTGQGGQFRMRLRSGTITAVAAAGILFCFQNPSALVTCLVHNVILEFQPIAGNTAGSIAFGLWFTRTFTAIDTGGVAAPSTLANHLDPTSSNNMSAKLIIANTGVMSAGTGTDDSQALSGLVASHPGVISTGNLTAQSFFSVFPGASTASALGGLGFPCYPLAFAQNEGFRIRADTLFPGGTDSAVIGVEVEWAEVQSF